MSLAGTVTVLGSLVLSAPSQAQDWGYNVGFLGIPSISGAPQTGNLLSATGASWVSPNPRDTAVRWEWWRCPSMLALGCQVVSMNQPTYRPVEADRGRYIAAARFARLDTGPRPGSALTSASRPRARR